MAEVVRTRFPSDTRLLTRRSLEDRLVVRWPSAHAAVARLLFRLPPRSRLRRALLLRNALSGWSAWSRWDFEVMLVRYATDCQFDAPAELVNAGMRESYHGHAGAYEWTRDMREAWEQMEITPIEIVDAGDRIVILGHIHTHARGSGIELDSRIGQTLWFRRGLIVRNGPFFDWEAALHAADLPSAAAAGASAAAHRHIGLSQH